MTATLIEWLNLALRWIHITVGIAWIGTSFFFIWLENHLVPPARPRDGVHGEVWMVHGGGFYHLQKFLVAPAELPRDLHWFKWEAYATWLSGLLLLSLIYFLGAKAYLIRPDADLSPGAAIGIALAVLALGWLIYDGACRALQGQDDLLGILVFAWSTAVAWGLSQVFTGRGAYILVGAMLGTIMAANVFLIIIPNQRKIVGALMRGQAPDAKLAKLGAMGRQRSLHNNYFTLPVLFIMISNHYPSTFGNRAGWLILACLAGVGMLVRHYFNKKNQGRPQPWMLATAATAMVALALVAAPRAPSAPAGEAAKPVSFAEVDQVIRTRCVACHSRRPTFAGISEPPKGILLEHPQQISAQAQQIYAQAVATQTMPLGNQTGMTPAERQLLGRWISQGAKLN